MATQKHTLRRLPVKYIRDRAKKAYEKEDSCYVCDKKDSLELHHLASLTDLWERWTRKNKIKINTEEDVLAHRDRFIEDHQKELYEDVVTLCKTHHMALHSLFGKVPVITSVPGQRKWLEIQRERSR